MNTCIEGQHCRVFKIVVRDRADHQDAERDDESVQGLYVRDNCEDGVPDQAPRTRRDARFVDGKIESSLSGHWDLTHSETYP